jgi:hypothetical protein
VERLCCEGRACGNPPRSGPSSLWPLCRHRLQPKPGRIRYHLPQRSRCFESACRAAKGGRFGRRLLTSINRWMRTTPQTRGICQTIGVQILGL